MHALHTMPEVLAIDPVAIAEKIGRRSVVREGLHDLLGRPVRGGVLGHVEVEDTPAMVSEHEEDEKHSQACAGDREEVDRDQVPDVVGEERPPGLGRRGAPLREQPGDGALGHVDAELEELAMDSRGSPERIRPAKRVTKALISALTGGRPPVDRSESLAQCSRKRRRCQRRTVSGATITRAALHPVHTLDRHTQKSRSPLRSFGRLAVRLYTASCWRKARFSRASWRWPPQRNGKRRST